MPVRRRLMVLVPKFVVRCDWSIFFSQIAASRAYRHVMEE